MLRWIFAEGKMRAMFSMLFGAGAVLLTDRAERRGGGDKVADIFLRRNMWLVLLGALHGYLIWYGDILFWYGITGLLFLFPMRKLAPKTLIRTSRLPARWCGCWWLAWAVSWARGPPNKKGVNAAIAAVARRQDADAGSEGRDRRQGEAGRGTGGTPPRRWKRTSRKHKSYGKAFGADAKEEYEASSAVYFAFPDVLIFMLLGMALYKNGFLTNQTSRRRCM